MTVVKHHLFLQRKILTSIAIEPIQNVVLKDTPNLEAFVVSVIIYRTGDFRLHAKTIRSIFNIYNRYWGATLEKYQRIIDASYFDFSKHFAEDVQIDDRNIKDRFEVSVDGEERIIMLPNARKLSRDLHYDFSKGRVHLFINSRL